ncbi:MAG: Smr/MutS family protein [Caulobacterales bacterium]
MKRTLAPTDLRLWAVVASTVRPLPGKRAPAVVSAATPAKPGPPPPTAPAKPAPARKPVRPADGLEPGLHRRVARGREPLAARVDLHGLDQDAARAALTRFVERAAAEGWRAVLVITGKGARGDGVLRRRVPDWLAEPPLRALVAGVSEAHRRHGGEGALYLALKHRARA